MINNAPPMVAAKMFLPPETSEEMLHEHGEVRKRFDTGTDGRVEIDSTYLMVLARKPE